MGGKPDRTTTLQLAQRLEDGWRDALVRKDEVALRAMLHPEFELVGMRANGVLSIGVDKWMTALSAMDIAAVNATVLGALEVDHTLICSVDACWNVRYRGQTVEERVLLTDVWIKAGNEWQALGRHSSLVPAGVEIGRPR